MVLSKPLLARIVYTQRTLLTLFLKSQCPRCVNRRKSLRLYSSVENCMSQALGKKAMPSTQEEGSLHHYSEDQGQNLLVLRDSLAKVSPDEIRSGNNTTFFKDREYRVELNKNSSECGIFLHFLFHSAVVQYLSSRLQTAAKPVWGE